MNISGTMMFYEHLMDRDIVTNVLL